MCDALTIGKLRYRRYEADGWRGWVLAGYEAEFGKLDEWLANSPQHLVLDALCRKVARHERPDGNLYSKLMWAQNDGALQKHELFSLLKWAWGPSRAVTVLKTTAKF